MNFGFGLQQSIEKQSKTEFSYQLFASSSYEYYKTDNWTTPSDFLCIFYISGIQEEIWWRWGI